MLQKDKLKSVSDLRRLIFESLSQRINQNCALVDLPYYKNIGDVLIWQGEETFLRDIGRNVIYRCSSKTCSFPDLKENVTILFNGGGNIGDLYPGHSMFLLKIIEKYADNTIVVFPQTVYFKDMNNEASFFKCLKNHDNFTFCCRDYKSHEIASKYLGKNCILLPDMAFCIDTAIFNKWQKPTTRFKLHIKRNDVERSRMYLSEDFEKKSDWPPFEQMFSWEIIVNTFFDRCISFFPFLRNMWDIFSKSYFKNDMISTGVKFISPFSEIFSERLHGAILSILLDKKVTILDNSYGKNSTFYNSWLSDFENVTLLTR